MRACWLHYAMQPSHQLIAHDCTQDGACSGCNRKKPAWFPCSRYTMVHLSMRSLLRARLMQFSSYGLASMLADRLPCKLHGLLCLTAPIMLSNGDRRLEGVLRGSSAIDAIWWLLCLRWAWLHQMVSIRAGWPDAAKRKIASYALFAFWQECSDHVASRGMQKPLCYSIALLLLVQPLVS